MSIPKLTIYKQIDKIYQELYENYLAASGLNSSTNTQDITNDVISPFEPNTITRVTNAGIGQVIIEYKDGTPSIIRDSVVWGVNGKGGANKKSGSKANGRSRIDSKGASNGKN